MYKLDMLLQCVGVVVLLTVTEPRNTAMACAVRNDSDPTSFLVYVGTNLTLQGPSSATDRVTECDWMIQSAEDQRDHVIRLWAVNVTMTAPPDHQCSSEYIVVYDGNSDSAKELTRLCLSTTEVDVVTSTGPSLYIRFYSTWPFASSPFVFLISAVSTSTSETDKITESPKTAVFVLVPIFLVIGFPLFICRCPAKLRNRFIQWRSNNSHTYSVSTRREEHTVENGVFTLRGSNEGQGSDELTAIQSYPDLPPLYSQLSIRDESFFNLVENRDVSLQTPDEENGDVPRTFSGVDDQPRLPPEGRQVSQAAAEQMELWEEGVVESGEQGGGFQENHGHNRPASLSTSHLTTGRHYMPNLSPTSPMTPPPVYEESMWLQYPPQLLGHVGQQFQDTRL